MHRQTLLIKGLSGAEISVGMNVQDHVLSFLCWKFDLFTNENMKTYDFARSIVYSDEKYLAKLERRHGQTCWKIYFGFVGERPLEIFKSQMWTHGHFLMMSFSWSTEITTPCQNFNKFYKFVNLGERPIEIFRYLTSSLWRKDVTTTAWERYLFKN